MTDMQRNMRAEMKKFCLPKEVISPDALLSDFPLLWLSHLCHTAHLRGTLGLHKPEKCINVCVFPCRLVFVFVCVCVCMSSALASGVTVTLQESHDHIKPHEPAPSLGTVAPWSVFHLSKRSWPQIGTRNTFSVWFLTYHSCVTPTRVHTGALISGVYTCMHTADEHPLIMAKSEQLHYTRANENHHI